LVPSTEQKREQPSHPPLRASSATSNEVDLTAERYVPKQPTSYLVTRSGSKGAISRTQRLPHRSTVPRSLRIKFILPCLISSTEYLSRNLPVDKRPVLLGFLPLSRQHYKASTQHVGTHSHARVRPQAFSASRRLAPPCSFRAYCIPEPRQGFSAQGFLPIHSHLDSSPRGASMPLLARRSPASQLPRMARSASRP